MFRAWKIENKKKEKLDKAKNDMSAAEPETESTTNEQDADEEKQRSVTALSSPVSS